MTRKVLIVLTDRANLGRLCPVMRAIHDDPRLTLQVVCAGTMPLARFGRAVDIVRADGFPVDAEIYAEVEGNLPGTMARSIGAHVPEFCAAFERLKPDTVVVIGDRYETLAAAIAAATMGIKLLHFQGGEVSECTDNKYRHMITKAADWHWPATQQAANNLERMGEPKASIVGIGCPSADLAAIAKRSPELAGHLLCIYHPNTSRYGTEREQIDAVLAALGELAMPTIWLWPNADAGADVIMKAIRVFRNEHDCDWLDMRTNLPPLEFMSVLSSVACCVGNSSSMCRDSSFSGVPVVLVGDRQNGRESAENVVRVPCDAAQIASAVRAQIAHGRYESRDLYGGERIGCCLPGIGETVADVLARWIRLDETKELSLGIREKPTETSLCAAAME